MNDKPNTWDKVKGKASDTMEKVGEKKDEMKGKIGEMKEKGREMFDQDDE